MNIEISEIRLQNSGRALKAFVDVCLDGITVRDFRVIQEHKKRPWVACPQVSWRSKDGIIKYKTIITFPDDQKGLIDLAVLNVYQREMENLSETKDKQK
jgi:DNA-binding cell septation regulator SpoVG